MTQLIRQGEAELVLHVRLDGRSEELSLALLQIDQGATDEQIKYALAAHFDRSVAHFGHHVVVRTSQAIIVRPEAIYG